jgi:Ni/Co efflux regulator RcnB
MFTPEQRVVNKYTREPVKITDEHIEGIMRWITERDMQILMFLLRHPFATVEQIEMTLFSSMKPSNWRTKSNERLRRLYRVHCIDRWFPPVAEGAGSAQQHIILDKAGLLVIAKHKGYDPKKIKWRKRTYIPQNYRHTLKIQDFKAMLHALNHQITGGEIINWKQEHEAKIQYRTEEGRREVIPDAMCIYKYRPNGAFKIFFLEVDNATEDLDRLRSKIKRYVECHRSGEWREKPWARLLNDMFPAVCLIAHDKATIIELCNYSKTLQTNIKFLFTTYDQLITYDNKTYTSKGGKTRNVPNSVIINILSDIWITNNQSGLVNL